MSTLLKMPSVLEKRAKLQVGTEAGMLVLKFEKEVSWLTMTKAEGIRFIQTLADHVNRL